MVQCVLPMQGIGPVVLALLSLSLTSPSSTTCRGESAPKAASAPPRSVALPNTWRSDDAAPNMHAGADPPTPVWANPKP